MPSTCPICDPVLLSPDPRKQFCSNACKQAAHRHARPQAAARTGLTQPTPPSLVPSRRLPPHQTPKAPTRLETVSRTLLGIGQQINRFQRQQNSLLGQIAWLEPPPSPKIDWVQRQRPWRTRFEDRSYLFLRGKEKFYTKFCPSSGSFGLAS